MAKKKEAINLMSEKPKKTILKIAANSITVTLQNYRLKKVASRIR